MRTRSLRQLTAVAALALTTIATAAACTAAPVRVAPATAEPASASPNTASPSAAPSNTAAPSTTAAQRAAAPRGPTPPRPTIRPAGCLGAVTYTIDRATGNRVITVVVKASSPPKPSPACLGAGTILALDAAESGPDWNALCMKVGAVVRFEHLGPDGLSVSPAGAVSCSYEAAVHPCRFVKPGT